MSARHTPTSTREKVVVMSIRWAAIPVLFLLLGIFASPLFAQFEKIQPPESEGDLILGEAQTTRYQVGMRVSAERGESINIYGTIPVPADWPEQTVKIVEEDISPNVGRIQYRMLEGTVKQMMVSIPRLGPGEVATAIITLEVEKRSAKPPAETSGLAVPRRVPLAMRRYMGMSPYIEARHGEIRSQAKKITADLETDWERIEAIYDWVRENVEYTKMQPTTALTAMREGKGDFEDLTGLFIALCRAEGFPTRTVWIPNSSYAEFYLEDEEGKGQWYPCLVAGNRAFGEMPDNRPILLKGDNFRVPEKKEPVRFVSEYLNAKAGRFGGKPKVEFIREVVGS